MTKILNYIGYSTLLATFVISLVLIPNHAVLAASDNELKEEAKVELLNSLLSQINDLLKLVKDREDFARNWYTIERADNTGRSEDFFLRIGEDSPSVVYGSQAAPVIIETDGGVKQILVTSSCNDDESEILLLSANQCEEETWIMEAELNNGVNTFTIPVALNTGLKEDIIKLSFFACRFDGCVFERDLALPYKEEITFADQVEIYDRYEWEYEWNDRVYHVQEVMLNFPYKDIKRVKLRVRCDVSGLYIRTDEDDRATCNNRREYTQPDYRDSETDEQGNVYNLRIESVTRDSVVENSGAVEMEFLFINKRNAVAATIYHRPIQEEVLNEEDDEEVR